MAPTLYKDKLQVMLGLWGDVGMGAGPAIVQATQSKGGASAGWAKALEWCGCCIMRRIAA